MFSAKRLLFFALVMTSPGIVSASEKSPAIPAAAHAAAIAQSPEVVVLLHGLGLNRFARARLAWFRLQTEVR